MIHPNMCTMLGFITTDAAISREMLQAALSEDVKDTYNMVSVDGDTSTNDTVLLLANGMAGNPEITQKDQDYEAFKAALHQVNETLAKKIAGDGEGCTALFEVKITGAQTKGTGSDPGQIRHYLQPDQGGDLRPRCQLGEDPVRHGIFGGGF